MVKDRVRKKIEDNGIEKALHNYGTAVLVNIINENYVLPTRNFQTAHFTNAESIWRNNSKNHPQETQGLLRLHRAVRPCPRI